MSGSVSIDIDEKSQDGPQAKPHNGKSINIMEISPNEKYLVTYNNKDNKIVGWNVEGKKSEDINEGEGTKVLQKISAVLIGSFKKVIKEGEDKNIKFIKEKIYKSDQTVEVNDKEIRHMCVSDKKILAYIYNDNQIGKYNNHFCLKSLNNEDFMTKKFFY